MNIFSIKTRAMIPPKDDLYALFRDYLPKLKDGDVLVIASKVLAIHQGRCLKIEGQNKDQLIRREAEFFIPRRLVPGRKVMITIKENTLIPTAGIDESNAKDHYILWPTQIQESAKEIWAYLRHRHKIKRLGVIIADSHTIPLRMGTVGISIGSFGLEPINDYRGKPDIFGRKLKITRANVVDALSASAVSVMGEGRERVPLVIIRGAKNVHFSVKDQRQNLFISRQADIYRPLLKPFKKSKK